MPVNPEMLQAARTEVNWKASTLSADLTPVNHTTNTFDQKSMTFHKKARTGLTMADNELPQIATTFKKPRPSAAVAFNHKQLPMAHIQRHPVAQERNLGKGRWSIHNKTKDIVLQFVDQWHRANDAYAEGLNDMKNGKVKRAHSHLKKVLKRSPQAANATPNQFSNASGIKPLKTTMRDFKKMKLSLPMARAGGVEGRMGNEHHD